MKKNELVDQKWNEEEIRINRFILNGNAEKDTGEVDEKHRKIDKFLNGKQWDHIKRVNANMPTPISNYIKNIRDLKAGSLFAQNYTPTITANSIGDSEYVNKINLFLETKWKQLKYNSLINSCILDSTSYNIAIVYTGLDEEIVNGYGKENKDSNDIQKGSPVSFLVHPTNFIKDPGAFELKDAAYAGIKEYRRLEQVKAEFTQEKEKERLERFENQVSAAEKYHNDKGKYTAQDGTITIEGDYFKSGEVLDRLYMHSESNNYVFTILYEVVLLDGGQKEIYANYVIETTLIKRVKLSWTQDLPFSILYDETTPHYFWGISTVEIVLPSQEIINKIDSIILTLAGKHQAPVTLVSKNSGIPPEVLGKYINQPGYVISVVGAQVTNVVHQITPHEISPMLINLRTIHKNAMWEVANITEAYKGDSVGSLTTSSGVSDLIAQSNKGDILRINNLENFVSDLGKKIMDVYKHLIEGNNKGKFSYIDPEEMDTKKDKFINKEDFKKINQGYTFTIDATAKINASRSKEQKDIMTLTEIQLQYGANMKVPLVTPEEIIDALDLTNGKQIINRIRKQEKQNEEEYLIQNVQHVFDVMKRVMPGNEEALTRMPDIKEVIKKYIEIKKEEK